MTRIATARGGFGQAVWPSKTAVKRRHCGIAAAARSQSPAAIRRHAGISQVSKCDRLTRLGHPSEGRTVHAHAGASRRPSTPTRTPSGSMALPAVLVANLVANKGLSAGFCSRLG
ncbi:MAG: hypothetical protein ACK5QX_08775, partial [bacterium]